MKRANKMTAFEAARLTEAARRPTQFIATHFVHSIERLVRIHAAVGHNALTYVVPQFVFGMPKYELAPVVDCICKQLRDSGFKVSVASSVLMVSWSDTCIRVVEPRKVRFA